jgi:hypothetical protein
MASDSHDRVIHHFLGADLLMDCEKYDAVEMKASTCTIQPMDDGLYFWGGFIDLNANLTHIREDPSSYRCDPFKKR